MSEQFFGAVPLFSQPPMELVKPPEIAAVPTQPPTPLNPDEIQALDAVFTKVPDASPLAAMLTSWSASMLLADLAKDHFHLPEEDDDDPQDQEHPKLFDEE